MEAYKNYEQAYRIKCRDFFLYRYGHRVTIADVKAHPIPNNSLHKLLPYLLNDREFYQARIYISANPLFKDGFSIINLLWEALGTAPNDFVVLCDTIVNEHSPFSKLYLERQLPAHFKHWPNRPFPSLEDLAWWFTTWPLNERDIVYDMVQSRLWNYHRALHQANLKEFWGLKPPYENRIYPLEFGLMVFIEEQWRDLAWVYLNNAISTIPNLSKPECKKASFVGNRDDEKTYSIKKEVKTDHAVQVLFSAAGTGKTRQIFELLRQHWGFYMLAPNLAPTEIRPVDIDIIEPQRYSCSRDTYTMYEDYSQLRPKWDASSVEVFQPLVVARVALLYEFMRRYAKATPTAWLWLQISCGTFDPFDALYRLFRLSHPGYLGTDAAISIRAEMPGYMVPKCYALLEAKAPPSSNVPLYHCLDEAQYAFKTPEALSMFFSLYSTTILFPMLAQDGVARHDIVLADNSIIKPIQYYVPFSDTASWSQSDGMPTMNPSLVVSGTSLDLDKLEETLAKFRIDTWGDDELPPERWDKHQVHKYFPLIASDSDFWGLYEQHLTNIMSESIISRNSLGTGLPLLSRSGRPLAFRQLTEDDDLSAMRKWLWKPLEIPSLLDILALLNQAYLLVPKHDQMIVGAEENLPHTSLERLLDDHDSKTVLLALLYHLVQPFHHNANPRLTPFGGSILRLLAMFSNLHIDQVSQIIRGEASNPSKPRGSLAAMTCKIHDIFRNLYIRDIITHYSTSQRGRYRWSTIYIEEIMLLSYPEVFRNSSLRDIRLGVKAAKDKTYDAAVTALKSQIRKMRASGKTELAQDLFRAGIRAEIMSMPSIFMKKENAELVTYGFALVQREGESIRYTLAEPISVHAVMEYLRTEGRSEYQELMLQWLINTQEDNEVQAMFGKTTEWFMAMSLDYMLRPRPSVISTIPDLVNGSGRREILLSLLADSIAVDSENDQLRNLNSTVDMSNFILSESSSVFKYGSLGTIWNWMKQYREEGQASTPTFLFPDINAGPDLLFFLEWNKDSRIYLQTAPGGIISKILVAAQIKTGGGARFESAMETLIESNWHKNLDNEIRDAKSAELDQWHNTPFILLLICTGITVKQNKIENWIKKNSNRIPKGRFVCVLDETVTSSLWGEDFVALADAIKRHGSGAKETSSQHRDKRRVGEQTPKTLLVDRSRKRARPDQIHN